MVNILSELSSQKGDRTEQSNKTVADQCLKKPQFLVSIAKGLLHHDVQLVGDCAEVMTNVAEENAGLICPFINNLSPLLTHKNTRVRWEAMHAVSCIAELCPQEMAKLLPHINHLCQNDSSTIVRDYGTIAIGNYAKTGKKAAHEAFVYLKNILSRWQEKQAARVFSGLQNVFDSDTTLDKEILAIVNPLLNSKRPSVQKALKSLLKTIG